MNGREVAKALHYVYKRKSVREVCVCVRVCAYVGHPPNQHKCECMENSRAKKEAETMRNCEMTAARWLH